MTGNPRVAAGQRGRHQPSLELAGRLGRAGPRKKELTEHWVRLVAWRGELRAKQSDMQ